MNSNKLIITTKIKIITLIIIALFVGITVAICNQTTKKQTQIAKSNASFESKISTDTFMYIDYNADLDNAYLILQKDGKITHLFYDYEDDEIPKLYRGDLIEVQWRLENMWAAGEDNRPEEFKPFVKKIKKIKDGNVSFFRKKYAKPLKYTYSENYAEIFLDKIYKNVEYYLANSKQKPITEIISNQGTEISYSVEEQVRNGQNCFLIGISAQNADAEDVFASVVQWLYLNEDLDVIYEYDLANDELVEFK
jgi:hypothetical protein